MRSDDWTFVYLPDGRYAHIAQLLSSAHPEAPEDWWEPATWAGTGSQEEYEEAKLKPPCPKCTKMRLVYKKESS